MRTSKEGLSRKDLLFKAGAVLTLGASALGMTGCSSETVATEPIDPVATAEATPTGAEPSAESFFEGSSQNHEEDSPQNYEVSGDLAPEDALRALIALTTEQQLYGNPGDSQKLVEAYRNSPEAEKASDLYDSCAPHICMENYAKRVAGEGVLKIGPNLYEGDKVSEHAEIDRNAIQYSIQTSLIRATTGDPDYDDPFRVSRTVEDVSCVDMGDHVECTATITVDISNSDIGVPDGTSKTKRYTQVYEIVKVTNAAGTGQKWVIRDYYEVPGTDE